MKPTMPTEEQQTPVYTCNYSFYRCYFIYICIYFTALFKGKTKENSGEISYDYRLLTACCSQLQSTTDTSDYNRLQSRARLTNISQHPTGNPASSINTLILNSQH